VGAENIVFLGKGAHDGEGSRERSRLVARQARRARRVREPSPPDAAHPHTVGGASRSADAASLYSWSRPPRRVGCTNTISLQIPDFTTGEVVHATPSAELDASPRFGSSAELPDTDTWVSGPAGQSDPTVNLSVFRRHPACAAVMSAVEAEPELLQGRSSLRTRRVRKFGHAATVHATPPRNLSGRTWNQPGGLGCPGGRGERDGRDA
jgi:hypothetical protein